MPPHSEQIVSRICGALFRGSLDHKYRQKTGENSAVHLFSQFAGDIGHAVNFPYLAAILAWHDQEHSKFAWSLGVSLVALALSVGAIIAQVVAR
ncbi:hypothetical protein BRO03_17450 [Xanthomonas oryzae pv. oryzae]|nr:hypothetical protein BRO09_06570 [Xanthomonas oryzae pv. oryzae]RBB07448.1 hypothetical protein BRN97_23215 [Xanthomonas oryzae pv. oryzae]RBB07770.1 hypothetical protein BRO12_17440 [Xanthomonas oryzae pv. oryzae]RBB17211.1 hypothetical protein BRO13_17930 [Xanthomonas oryzae pv. oryzae]RBB24076.1 hypothetical protein BRO04_15960 [Xanthomonas oryzae pv. oryzae]